MDSLTQLTLGAVVGELVLGRKLGWKAAAWGAFFGTLPDLDVLATPFLDQVDQIKSHRGISHSILLMVLVPLLLAKPLALLHRRREVSAWTMALFLFLVWSTHVLIDCFTTYGTQVWQPFSDRKEAFNNMAIIDLFFTLPMLIGMVMVFFHDPLSRKRRRINAIALTISICYVGLSFTMKSFAEKNTRDYMAQHVPDGELVATSPTISNIVLWRALIETPDGYHVRYWSPFDRTSAEAQYFPKHHQLAQARENEELFQAAVWFSRGHYALRKTGDGALVIIDMRYGGMRDLETKRISPTFQWRMQKKDGEYSLQSYRPKRTKIGEQLALIWHRICGEQEQWQSVKPF